MKKINDKVLSVEDNKTRASEYLDLLTKRIKHVYLAWVEQVLDMVKGDTVNDIGCSAGQFWKGLKRRNLAIDYMGYDVNSAYLKIAKKFFPEIKVEILDIALKKPRQADTTVISATLEHIENYKNALKNMLLTTNKTIIIRTLLGDSFIKESAANWPVIYQFTFKDIMHFLLSYGFKPTVIRDKHTDSMPQHKIEGIIRTMYIVKGEKENRRKF